MRRFQGYARSKRSLEVLIAFNDGFLSFEVEDGEVVAVRAEGTWHGHAWIPAYYLAAFHASAPTEDPIEIRYQDGKVRISTLSIGCRWETVSAPLIRRAESPDTLELLALERTVTRAEVLGTPIGKKMTQAKRLASGAITRAAQTLAPFGITRDEIAAIVERQIQARIKRG